MIFCRRPSSRDNSKKLLPIRADRKIVDRCVHPDVHNDPLSCSGVLWREITARSVERLGGQGAAGPLRSGNRAADNTYVTGVGEIAGQLQRDGYAVIPGLLDRQALAAARAELGALLDAAEWGSGFDGTRTKRAWPK